MKITEEKIDSDFVERFEFTPIGDVTFFKNIYQKQNMELLEKWGLSKNSELFKMRFNLAFDLKDLEKFVLDLFNDVNFRNIFTHMGLISIPKEETLIKNFTFKKLSMKAIDLDILDVMCKGNKIVGKDSGNTTNMLK